MGEVLLTSLAAFCFGSMLVMSFWAGSEGHSRFSAIFGFLAGGNALFMVDHIAMLAKVYHV